ncbi:hypothetical protein [Pseudorhodoplanes sp.]|jgi:uncharacterized membrane protein YkoI|uniref:PepSY domain-containing protein n=1 Tax=Pseudorhodoplanes sp. TaxID=1934341 RepID=UPI002CE148F3|nr:hypothetical protein [Pseudorhodoplanes sp.]HWV41587.1 hypothetical protein [Pseudorhodoplanes sp.]
MLRMLSRTLILPVVLMAAALGASPDAVRSAGAAEVTVLAQLRPQCLTTMQRRSISASGKVVPLAKAIRAARARKADVVDAKLCKGPKGLVYLLTLLAQDGKVTRATVDAASGLLTDGG